MLSGIQFARTTPMTKVAIVIHWYSGISMGKYFLVEACIYIEPLLIWSQGLALHIQTITLQVKWWCFISLEIIILRLLLTWWRQSCLMHDNNYCSELLLTLPCKINYHLLVYLIVSDMMGYVLSFSAFMGETLDFDYG